MKNNLKFEINKTMFNTLSNKKQNSNSNAFTVIELLVVVAVIGLIASMVLVSMRGSTGKARISKSLEFSQTMMNIIGVDAVGIWSFDEGSGPTAFDKSGYGNHGTVQGATWVSGEENTPHWFVNESEGRSALNFDGATNRVRISANFHFDTKHGPSTLELWFNGDTLSGTRYIFSDNCIEWGIYHSGTTIYGRAYWAINGGTVSTGKWHHAVITHAHPTGLTNTKIKFYLDGELKGETVRTITTQNGYTDSPYYIGDDGCYANREFDGLIDEVRIYARALDSAEIQQHYADGVQKHSIALK